MLILAASMSLLAGPLTVRSLGYRPNGASFHDFTLLLSTLAIGFRAAEEGCEWRRTPIQT